MATTWTDTQPAQELRRELAEVQADRDEWKRRAEIMHDLLLREGVPLYSILAEATEWFENNALTK